MTFKQLVKVFDFGEVDVVITDGSNFKVTVPGKSVDLALTQLFALSNREITEISQTTTNGKTEYWVLLKKLTEYERTPKIKDIVKTCRFFNEHTKFIIRTKNRYKSVNTIECDYLSAMQMTQPVFSVQFDHICNHALITAKYTRED